MSCIGVFHSTTIDPELDSVPHCSALTVVWFQTAVSVPPGEDAAPALRGIDWDEPARDREV